MNLHPSKEEFFRLATQGNLIPVYVELLADCETPVDVYSKLREKGKNAFLFESAESSQASGRYSFIGFDIHTKFHFLQKKVEITEDGQCRIENMGADPLVFLQEYMEKYKPVRHGALPSFYGVLLVF